MASSTQLSSRTVPVLQAGGGHPSALESAQKIESFTAPVLSHLRTIFQTIASKQPLSKADAIRFLTEIQHEQDPASIPPLANRETIDQQAFLEYMASPLSTAMAPPKSHDLTRPISDYFISTSHNTYLSGNQLYGDASTQAYTNVLGRGCRCLEIDVWDGEPKSAESPDGEEQTVTKEEEKKDNGGDARRGKPSRWARMKARARQSLDNTTAAAITAASSVQQRYDQHQQKKAGMGGDLSPQQSRAEPRVLHGHTLTKEISFRSVCNAIRDAAFIATDLPIIVSLEVHAGLEQQEIMVEIMREAWKGMLVDLPEAEEKAIKQLPSPDQLRHKILIKVKWSSSSSDTNSKVSTSATGESNDPRDHVESSPAGDVETADSTDEERLPSTTLPPKQEKAKKASKILHALSELGVYTRAYSFKHFDQPESKIPTHVYSLSEQKVLDMHDSYGPQLFHHNRNYLMRVFPSGLRINSSNVEPTFLWRQGVQMVALNWQSWDKGMMLNEGMFAGEEGWVLKPTGFHSTTGPKATSASTPIPRKTLDLTIELLAGQNIPMAPGQEDSHLAHFQKVHPYVNAQLHVDNTPTISDADAVKHATTNSPGTSKMASEDNNQKIESARAEEREDSSSKFKRRSRTATSAEPDFLGETLRWSKVENVIEELSFLR